MVICVDLDGVITQGKHTYPNYSECEVNLVSVSALKHIKSLGHLIVIWTARWDEDRSLTEKWLKDNGVYYDELIMNKPLADIYIDDRAMCFSGEWTAILSSIRIYGNSIAMGDFCAKS